jgi:putative ABC transport system permease protein
VAPVAGDLQVGAFYFFRGVFMSDSRSINRSMFWRVLRRSVFANSGRLFVILLALGAGAAITAALLNLQVDAKRRITTEFRSFGANVIISPRGDGDSPRFLEESLFEKVPNRYTAGEVAKAEFLYGVVDVSVGAPDGKNQKTAASHPAIIAGYAHSEVRPKEVLPSALIDVDENQLKYLNSMHCPVGRSVASALGIGENGSIVMSSGSRQSVCGALVLPATGGPEDNQIFFYLPDTQELLGQPHRISVIQMSVPGTAAQVQQFIAGIQPVLGDAEGRPVRQFTEGEARLYGKISGILTATVAVVLVLTALCVMAAMTNVAMERKNDVGLMKAIGGSVRRVLRLFLAEAALLGLASGLIGAAIGIVLSIGLGKAVFGVAAQPRLIVYPISVALTVIVAILAAYPLRRLVHIRPASVFRGEE